MSTSRELIHYSNMRSTADWNLERLNCYFTAMTERLERFLNVEEQNAMEVDRDQLKHNVNDRK